MKLVMTLLARDESEIVDAQLAYHLNAGVDFVVATDNGSTDGTTEILERYERAGVLHLIREPGDAMLQSQWVTGMARLAATEFEADWVLNSDADEFWWPRSGSLKDVLATVPERFAVVRGAWRHFLPRPDGDGNLFERMTVRLRLPSFPGDKATIYHAHQKVAHRARSEVVVEAGNHDVTADHGRLVSLRGWYPLEVLHFSFRSRAQFERKAIRDYEAWVANPRVEPTLHHILAYEACRSDTLDEYYGGFVVDDEALAQGLCDGAYALDTRLRDALRVLRGDDGRFRLPEAASSGLAFPPPTLREDAEFVEEIAQLVEIDGLVRAEERVEALEKRLAALRRLARR
jgi:Glycosyl transferase family 2